MAFNAMRVSKPGSCRDWRHYNRDEPDCTWLILLGHGRLFLDSIIGSIVKSIRRESQANSAENRPLADAKI
jgi:hypothetical protein